MPVRKKRSSFRGKHGNVHKEDVSDHTPNSALSSLNQHHPVESFPPAVEGSQEEESPSVVVSTRIMKQQRPTSSGKKRKGVSISGSSREKVTTTTNTEHHLTGNTPTEDTAVHRKVATSTTIFGSSTSGSKTPTTSQQQQIPVTPRGEKQLTAFCSKFRVKKTKNGSNEDKKLFISEEKEDKNQNSTTTISSSNKRQPVGPMVKVVNGEIVLQESSVLVDGGETTKPEDEFPVVEEDAQPAIIGASYNSFVNRRKPQHWSPQETELFYDALRQVGVDFSSMESYFEKRTRKHLKKKYQAELAKNPHLVEAALNPSAKKDIGKRCIGFVGILIAPLSKCATHFSFGTDLSVFDIQSGITASSKTGSSTTAGKVLKEVKI